MAIFKTDADSIKSKKILSYLFFTHLSHASDETSGTIILKALFLKNGVSIAKKHSFVDCLLCSTVDFPVSTQRRFDPDTVLYRHQQRC